MASTPQITPHIKYNHTCFFCAGGLRFLSNVSSAMVFLAVQAARSPEAALYREFCVDFVRYCAEDKSRP